MRRSISGTSRLNGQLRVEHDKARDWVTAVIVMANQRLSLIKHIRDCEYANSMSWSAVMTGDLTDAGYSSAI
jgi:hypothetical protein